ncbi:hypothetical protein N7532_004808 [Penicillium argentinense]|uniref:Uncharacterized protein n=1 Tax=Penicillium argentinense TaxID=1131581 RepID=A0A9W9KF82_9EURO|nr:uncharacterized protein N7532_004808 [Penicillium argentinense]KAJ5104279.1 hypothetical protein N7532_004808 [Penicillium argentinense]
MSLNTTNVPQHHQCPSTSSISLNIINIPQHHQYPSTSSISLNIINIPQHHQYPSTSSISLNIINIPQHHQYPSTPTTLKTLIKTRNTDNPTVSPPYSYHRPLTILYTPGKPTPTLPPIHPTPPLLRITNAPSSSPIHILSPSFPSIFFTRPCAPGLYVPPRCGMSNAPSSSPIHILSPSFPSILFTRPCVPTLYVPRCGMSPISL